MRSDQSGHRRFPSAKSDKDTRCRSSVRFVISCGKTLSNLTHDSSRKSLVESGALASLNDLTSLLKTCRSQLSLRSAPASYWPVQFTWQAGTPCDSRESYAPATTKTGTRLCTRMSSMPSLPTTVINRDCLLIRQLASASSVRFLKEVGQRKAPNQPTILRS